MHTIDSWEGCYPSNWKGVIVPEAMAHPAKYSSKLIRRIYEHMFKEGWLHEGDKVLDPFGGVALGALDAMRLGLNWCGVELEAKFHGLGNQNIERWLSQFGQLPRWGSACLLNGDSRKLLSLIEARPRAAISSPPYAESIQTNDKGSGIDYSKSKSGGKGRTVAREAIATGYGSSDGQLGAMKADGFTVAISSPPYASTDLGGGAGILARDESMRKTHGMVLEDENYGHNSAQLANMPANGFDAAISSPPFLQSEGGTPEPKPGGSIDQALYTRHAAGNAKANGYGTSDGQLSSMKDGGFDAAISSPPFLTETEGSGLNINKPPTFRGVLKDGSLSMGESEGNLSSMPSVSFQVALSSPPYAEARIGQESGQEQCGRGDQYGGTEGQLGAMDADGFTAAMKSPPFEKTMVESGDPNYAHKFNGSQSSYGQSAGQLGNDSGDDFWLAARAIVEQVYLALAPGGHACWVVKDYVKNKKIVPFCDQWRQLCEAVGFVTVHEHHAMLVHKKGAQHTLEGGLVFHKSESKSFFRRLAEKNGSPRIDWETILCMEKPQ